MNKCHYSNIHIQYKNQLKASKFKYTISEQNSAPYQLDIEHSITMVSSQNGRSQNSRESTNHGICWYGKVLIIG